MRLRPGQYPGLRLGDRHVQDLVKARANPLPKYRLARVLLRYAPDKEALISTLERELVLVEAEAGTALERQKLVDLVQDLADRAAARPGVYTLVMMSDSGDPPTLYAFGTIVSESIATPTVGASAPDAPSPTAPMRIVLATVADAARAAREVAARAKEAAAEEVLRRR